LRSKDLTDKDVLPKDLSVKYSVDVSNGELKIQTLIGKKEKKSFMKFHKMILK